MKPILEDILTAGHTPPLEYAIWITDTTSSIRYFWGSITGSPGDYSVFLTNPVIMYWPFRGDVYTKLGFEVVGQKIWFQSSNAL